MKRTCYKCGKEMESENMCHVDGHHICNPCMYGDVPSIPMYPIGFVRNTQERSDERFGLKRKSEVSKIVLLESQKPFMYRLEDETKLTIIYFLHKAKPVKSVFHRGIDGKKVGVFASRTPDRLSGLAIQNVRLERIDGTTLYVKGLDAVDGSPVLDIKLYLGDAISRF